MKAAEQLEDLGRAVRVERPRGLVREHERGLVRKRSGNGESLPLAARKEGGELPLLPRQAEQVEEVAGPSLGLRSSHPGDHRRQRDVLERRHPVQEVEELEHEPDVLAAKTSKSALVLP